MAVVQEILKSSAGLYLKDTSSLWGAFRVAAFDKLFFKTHRTLSLVAGEESHLWVLSQGKPTANSEKWDIITPHARGIIGIFSPEGVLMLPKGL